MMLFTSTLKIFFGIQRKPNPTWKCSTQPNDCSQRGHQDTFPPTDATNKTTETNESNATTGSSFLSFEFEANQVKRVVMDACKDPGNIMFAVCIMSMVVIAAIGVDNVLISIHLDVWSIANVLFVLWQQRQKMRIDILNKEPWILVLFIPTLVYSAAFSLQEIKTASNTS